MRARAERNLFARASVLPVQRAIIFIFHFFELSVDNIVVFRVARLSVSGTRLLLSVLLLSNFHQLLRSLRQRLHFRFDIRFVFAFQRRFQRGQRRLNGSFVVSRQFIACFFNLLTSAVQQMVARLRVCTSSSNLRSDSALASASRTIF